MSSGRDPSSLWGPPEMGVHTSLCQVPQLGGINLNHIVNKMEFHFLHFSLPLAYLRRDTTHFHSFSCSWLHFFLCHIFYTLFRLFLFSTNYFLSLSFLLLCKKYIYLYIWLIPSSLHTDTTHNYSSQWLVIISKATQLPLFLTGPFALVEWNGS